MGYLSSYHCFARPDCRPSSKKKSLHYCFSKKYRLSRHVCQDKGPCPAHTSVNMTARLHCRLVDIALRVAADLASNHAIYPPAATILRQFEGSTDSPSGKTTFHCSRRGIQSPFIGTASSADQPRLRIQKRRLLTNKKNFTSIYYSFCIAQSWPLPWPRPRPCRLLHCHRNDRYRSRLEPCHAYRLWLRYL